MALIGTVALVILIVALRLFLPPAPGLLSLARRFGKTMVFLASAAIALAAMAILILRR
jgi:hypothetical protein